LPPRSANASLRPHVSLFTLQLRRLAPSEARSRRGSAPDESCEGEGERRRREEGWKSEVLGLDVGLSEREARGRVLRSVVCATPPARQSSSDYSRPPGRGADGRAQGAKCCNSQTSSVSFPPSEILTSQNLTCPFPFPSSPSPASAVPAAPPSAAAKGVRAAAGVAVLCAAARSAAAAEASGEAALVVVEGSSEAPR
jgi:hypothetical protein